MALFFDGSNTYLIHNDITTARFLRTTAWTACIFVKRDPGEAGFTDIFYAKYGSGSTQQFRFEFRNISGNDIVRFYHNGGSRVAGNAVIAVDTWYAVGGACDGAGNLTLYVVNMNGTVLDNNTGTTAADQSDLTAPITIGVDASIQGDVTGHMANCCYIDKALTVDEFVEYARAPYLSYVRHGGQFFIPMLGKDPEPDWSGKKQYFTPVNNPVVSDNPPVAPIVSRNRSYQSNVKKSLGLSVV
jgi:hypothetical protein